jgi:hypothetical protein
MPKLIDPGEGAAITLDELVAALDAEPGDLADQARLAAFGPLLARLARNPDFLAEAAVAELKARHRVDSTIGGYGAQVLMLRPANGRYVLRAKFWPAESDSVVRASGAAPFFYHHAHDHNFAFLTVGYAGPGYWSDVYEYDIDRVVGIPGEKVDLAFIERIRLDPGKVLLYRARRDVHVQLPPDAFSVSLNILAAEPAQIWRDQFRFDIATGTIAETLTVAPSEALVALAVHLGGDDGYDLASGFAARHPSSRMRVAALAALASAAPDRAAACNLFESAAGDVDPYVAGHARRRLALLENDP